MPEPIDVGRLGQRLRRARRYRGVTLEDVFKRTGISVATLSRVERAGSKDFPQAGGAGRTIVARLCSRVRRIMDLKCPGSGEAERNRWENLRHLKNTDEIKFVIGTREDYDWAKANLVEYNLASLCPILFSWVTPLQPHQQDKSLKRVPADLAPISRLELVERMIADALPVRFQLQMHKFVWPPDQRGV